MINFILITIFLVAIYLGLKIYASAKIKEESEIIPFLNTEDKLLSFEIKQSLRRKMWQAETLIKNKEFEKANRFLRKQIKISQKEAQLPEEIDFYLIMGQLQRLQKNFAQALLFFKEAGRLAQECSYLEAEALALASTAGIYSLQGQYSLSIIYYEKSLKINKQLNNRQEQVKQLTKIGLIYEKLQDNLKAQYYFDKASIVSAEADDDSQDSSTQPSEKLLVGANA